MSAAEHPLSMPKFICMADNVSTCYSPSHDYSSNVASDPGTSD